MGVLTFGPTKQVNDVMIFHIIQYYTIIIIINNALTLKEMKTEQSENGPKACVPFNTYNHMQLQLPFTDAI